MHGRSTIVFIALCYLGQAFLAVPPLLEHTPQKALLSSPRPTATNKSLQVPGLNPAYYCSDPSDDAFNITRLDFYPLHPQIGYYFTIVFRGYFTSNTGDIPWLNITGTINGTPEREPFYKSPLCDIDVFQDIPMPTPGPPRKHRSCPPAIHKGYASIGSPPIPLTPYTAEVGEYELRAEATTQDGARIFCVEGKFNVTSEKRRRW